MAYSPAGRGFFVSKSDALNVLTNLKSAPP